MNIFLYIAIYFTLFLIVYQDIKERQIWWFLPPLLLFFLYCISFHTVPFINYQLSLFYLIFLLFFLFVYIRIRFKSFNLFKDFFGIGDLLVLLSIIPFFYFKEYIYFTTIATFISLILHYLPKLSNKNSSIPYAGYISIVFGIYLIIFLFTGIRVLSHG